MDADLKDLLEEQEKLKIEILNLETKNFFVIAFLKAMKSKEFKSYMKLKKEFESPACDKQLIATKLTKLESYGSVSDYLYLLNHCKDVLIYINLRIQMFEIERQIQNFDFKEEAKSKNDVELINKYLDGRYIEKNTKTLIK